LLSVPPDAVCHFFTTLNDRLGFFVGVGVGVFVGFLVGVGVGVSVGGVPVGGVVVGVSSPVVEIFVTLNSSFVLAALWASLIGV
jgi:hypothetical protein